ncbi:MAG: exodeoxyribonuclease VII small subunit [Rhodobacteraceae bacterium]|nr:exodeoxyribonuclease VII small subunit [Paracoccaceae bacterium]
MSESKPIEEMPFEEALAELEEIVSRLESGDTPLDEAIQLYQRGSKLKTRCETTLKSAEEKIGKITLGANGKPEEDDLPF